MACYFLLTHCGVYTTHLFNDALYQIVQLFYFKLICGWFMHKFGRRDFDGGEICEAVIGSAVVDDIDSFIFYFRVNDNLIYKFTIC